MILNLDIILLKTITRTNIMLDAISAQMPQLSESYITPVYTFAFP